ncbi:hypothetical protein ACJMK2_043583 [Sinanodonta woodiana]|uniref:Reverse transcriptase domain-containing protein n=1 Tax=Sinanodonta woodiana TaxID=1069815 RepID=A0ABD3W0Y6_SINWO
MTTTTNWRRNGIQWTLWSQLEDLDFADDLALLSHSQQQMQEKTNILAATSAQVGLNIHKDKTKILKINYTSKNPVTHTVVKTPGRSRVLHVSRQHFQPAGWYRCRCQGKDRKGKSSFHSA